MKAIITFTILLIMGTACYFVYRNAEHPPSSTAGLSPVESSFDEVSSGPDLADSQPTGAVPIANKPATASGVEIDPERYRIATFEMW